MKKLPSGISAIAVLSAAVLMLPVASLAAAVPVRMPEPSSLPMLMAGLAGLGAFSWRFRRSGK